MFERGFSAIDLVHVVMVNMAVRIVTLEVPIEDVVTVMVRA